MADTLLNQSTMIPMPGTSSMPKQAQKQLLFSTVGFDKRGGVVKAGQGVIEEGQIMAVETATKLFVKYAEGGADGSQIAVGVNMVPVTTTTENAFTNIGISGVFKEDQLVGLTAAAKASLGGRSIPPYGAFKF